uniref:Uncharacterized protein n=1 Tax=Nothobranchius kadleci TaxID=1051664 RepID=A0A1A8EIQ9_NOTKA
MKSMLILKDFEELYLRSCWVLDNHILYDRVPTKFLEWKVLRQEQTPNISPNISTTVMLHKTYCPGNAAPQCWEGGIKGDSFRSESNLLSELGQKDDGHQG